MIQSDKTYTWSKSLIFMWNNYEFEENYQWEEYKRESRSVDEDLRLYQPVCYTSLIPLPS